MGESLSRDGVRARVFSACDTLTSHKEGRLAMQAAVAVAAPNPALIFETLLAHQRSAALRTAIELNVVGAVGEGPADARTLAARCSVSERGIRILCDFLTIMGLLEKQDGVYSH